MTNTPLPDELHHLIHKTIIPSSIGYVLSVILLFVVGRLISRQDGFTNATKTYGFSFLFSGLNALICIAAGIFYHQMKTRSIFLIAFLLFLFLYFAVLICSQYITYHALKKSFQIGRIKSMLFLLALLVPGFVANAGWAWPNKSERSPSSVDRAFIQGFRAALDDDFSDLELSKLMVDHAPLLMPNDIITQVMFGKIPAFPLSEFKSENLYLKNIPKLLGSTNKCHRELAYMVIGATGDTSKSGILLERLKTETDESILNRVAMSLMNLNTPHTTAIFDYLVKYETLEDAHLLPVALKLDPDSLQQTAYAKIHSQDEKEKVVAAVFLSVTKPNDQSEALLKQAIRDWDIGIKGFAIQALSEHQYGNVLETVMPLLENPKTRSVSLQALANSPSAADQAYLAFLIGSQDTIATVLLNSLFLSKNLDNVTLALRLLYTKPIPSNFHLQVSRQPLITSDKVLPEVHAALEQVNDPELRRRLVPVLGKRTDDKSLDLLISLLDNEDRILGRAAARCLKDNPSARAKDEAVQKRIEEALSVGNRTPSIPPDSTFP